MQWSLKLYIGTLIITSTVSVILTHIDVFNVLDFIQKTANYLAILSVTLIGFPLLAVPLMMQVINTAIELVGEKPSKDVYRDFNIACLVVSLGSLAEILLLLLGLVLEKPNWLAILISSLAVGNFVAYILVFILVIILLEKIIIELEIAFTQ